MDDSTNSVSAALNEANVSAALNESQAEAPGLYQRWHELYQRKFQAELSGLSIREDRELRWITALILDGLSKILNRKFIQSHGHEIIAAKVMAVAAFYIIQEMEVKKSNRAWSSRQEVAIDIVAAYYKAIKNGLFTDGTPNKSVRDRYEVDDTSVQKWAKLEPGAAYDALEKILLRVSWPIEDIDRLRKEEAQKILTIGGRMYRQE